MKKLMLLLAMVPALAFAGNGWISVKGREFVDEAGKKFSIKGTNFGQWLNPEGYMLRFHKCNSPRFIDEAFRQMVGPEETDRFWNAFVDSFITEADVEFVAKRGFNTVRLPFHYKLFTDDPYLGGRNRGFELFDKVLGWAKKHGVYLILDMHDAPGGQTGDNIDDSYGWPWLYESEDYQRQFRGIWRKIAARYANEPHILGYDLMNEPLGWQVKFDTPKRAEYEGRHERICKDALKAIREVDSRHIVFFPGTWWNTHFQVFSDYDCDKNLAYECHSYGTNTVNQIVNNFAPFSKKANRPMWMGETGQDTTAWTVEVLGVLAKEDIGYTFWCYKMPPFSQPGRHSGLVTIRMPEGWSNVTAFVEGPRRGFGEIDQTLFDTVKTRAEAKKLLDSYLEGVRFENCTPDEKFIGLFFK